VLIGLCPEPKSANLIKTRGAGREFSERFLIIFRFPEKLSVLIQVAGTALL